METQERLISLYIDSICKKIAKNTIWHLQRIRETLSGDDSPLKNAWDEICVEIQYERSFFWDVYELTSRAIIQGSIEEMDDTLKRLIWFQTDEGYMEDNDKEFSEEDVVDYIFQEYVLYEAGRYSNKKIEKVVEKYLYGNQ